jgi:hypothetical protein
MIPFKADKDLAKKRIEICEGCDYFKPETRTCGTPVIGDKIGDKKTCGCFMDIKTKLTFSKCPFSFWGVSQVAENDYIAIKKLLKDVQRTINPQQKEVLFDMQRKYFGGNKKTSNCVPCIKSALEEMKQVVEEYEKE